MRGTRHKPKEAAKITEGSIQRVLISQFLSNPKYWVTNTFIYDWESDFLAKTKSGYWYEVEIKISVSDFKNDAKNKVQKFEVLRGEKEGLRPNYFSCCVPESLVEKILPLLPDYAGLYCVSEPDGKWLKQVRKPKAIHSEKIEDSAMNLSEKFYYKWDALRNMDLRDEIKELKGEISFLRAEYKAATGESIWDAIN